MLTALERFAFNQARFVFHAQYTIERRMISGEVSFSQAFEEIRNTPMGQRYLLNVSEAEMRREDRRPGSFMDANTDLGCYCNDEYGNYVEDFKEK